MFEALIILILAVFATARLTRLLVHDRVFRAARTFVVRKRGAESVWSYFVFCPHCVSFWLAAATGVFVWWGAGLDAMFSVPWWAGFPLVWLAVSYLSAMIVSKETQGE